MKLLPMMAGIGMLLAGTAASAPAAARSLQGSKK
jgi:hypothetical protein